MYSNIPRAQANQPFYSQNVAATTSRDNTMRQDIALNLLQEFLSFKKPHSDHIHPQPNNFFLLEEIVNEDSFKHYKFNVPELIQAIHADPQLRFSIRENRVRFKPPELNKETSVQISKKLAWITRHGAGRVNLQYLDGGFLFLDDVLALDNFAGITRQQIEDVVNDNNKRRFEIREDPEGSGRSQIRAVQGHSVEIRDLDLKTLTDPSAFPEVIHGTYYRAWADIKNSGLCRMQRNHIHFAPGESPDDGVVSGMRNSAEVLIFIDLPAAIKDGYQFFVSANNVILCPGDAQGFLPSRYFKSAIDRKTSEQSSVIA
ncbi:tRNA 2'-phosphotransferase 1 [Cichlidogyrus casuarinus]|uniref:2'-phosphotransferase n=1 Tax=Cichlidogyrus casuarinus TaxID=1844966 RepID=A0ABD2QM47_9PLAT